ncbi:hypothetical protein RhiJN_08246 [Ceratobasidium sp. AG-Ba]|nr:hypothetical protein RhiJN_08246 [Ceratobasidium sp. AG-Ba]QRW09029.1 hypothetical protein RhiLY_08028 [Ceratobasidium sp. AG-Ba]
MMLSWLSFAVGFVTSQIILGFLFKQPDTLPSHTIRTTAPVASPEASAWDDPYDPNQSSNDIDEESYFQTKLALYRSQSLKQLKFNAKFHAKLANKYTTIINAKVEAAGTEDETYDSGRKKRLEKKNTHWLQCEQKKAEVRLKAVTVLISEKEAKSKQSQT